MYLLFNIWTRRPLYSEVYNLVGLANSFGSKTWSGNAPNHVGDPYSNGVFTSYTFSIAHVAMYHQNIWLLLSPLVKTLHVIFFFLNTFNWKYTSGLV